MLLKYLFSFWFDCHPVKRIDFKCEGFFFNKTSTSYQIESIKHGLNLHTQIFNLWIHYLNWFLVLQWVKLS
jgi:hypothetical protein